MHALKELIASTIARGLQKESVKTCSRWSENYRVMSAPFAGKWSFDHHPWLLEMHNAVESKIIGQKAAQMGYTEWAMNMAFFFMDIKGWDVLYVLPTSSDASDFSAARFDTALELSPYLRNFFADVNNVGLKRAGSNILYVRGSHSRSKLKSIPTPVIIFDEVDEMPKGTIALAEERQSGQVETKTLQLSTPTIQDMGINVEFSLSTEDYFHFKCPSCSRFISLDFPDSLVVTADSLTDPKLKDSYLKCNYCKAKLPHEDKVNFLKHKQRGGNAHFVSSHTDRDVRGFHVSQFYSMAKAGNPANLAVAALKADRDESYAQEWYNSKGGKTYTAEGAKITDKLITASIKSFKKGQTRVQGYRTLGIDVGSVLHMVVKEFVPGERLPGLKVNDYHTARILYEGTSSGSPSDFDEAFDLFHHYGCKTCVVDAEPERRSALQFAQRLWGKVLLCDYIYSQHGREAQVNKTEATIKVNRTSWLDLTLGRYKNGTVDLPIDTSEEFKRHIKEPVRVYKEDKYGQKYAVYLNAKADHFAHADNYAEIAFPMACGIGTNRDIVGMY